MNIPTSTSPKPNPDLLRKIVQDFQPNPRRIPFRNLEPFRDSIEILRAKGASYAAIAQLLRQHGVKTSRARVVEYGRIVLEKQKPRKRRKRAAPLPVAVPTTPLQAPISQSQPLEPSPSLSSSNSPRGPHIANVRMVKRSTT